jgi:hypothetical protein
MHSMDDQKKPFRGKVLESGYPRLILTMAMIMLLMIVMFVMFRILPLREETRLSNRKAKRLIEEAGKWEEKKLHLAAADNYQRVLGQHHLKPTIRADAARMLSRLYIYVLRQPDAGQAALEKAIILTESETEKQRLTDKLEALWRNTPPPGGYGMEGRPAADDSPAAPPDHSGEVIAAIGDREVTLEEILFSWSVMNGREKPEAGKLEPFVHHYLDMVLLASEAELRDLHRGKRIVSDLKLKRLVALNQSIMKQLVEELAEPGREKLETFYRENLDLYRKEPQLVIGHFAVDQADIRDRVVESIASGMAFQQAAFQYAIGRESPETCIRIGNYSPEDAVFEGIGDLGGLVRGLVGHEDGYTTGPIELNEHWYWFRIFEQARPDVMPFDVVRQELLLKYQQQKLAESRKSLLNRLKNEQSIEIKPIENMYGYPDVNSGPPLAETK